MGCHCLLQGNLSDPGIEPSSRTSPALAGASWPLAPPGKPSIKVSRPGKSSGSCSLSLPHGLLPVLLSLPHGLLPVLLSLPHGALPVLLSLPHGAFLVLLSPPPTAPPVLRDPAERVWVSQMCSHSPRLPKGGSMLKSLMKRASGRDKHKFPLSF